MLFLANRNAIKRIIRHHRARMHGPLPTNPNATHSDTGLDTDLVVCAYVDSDPADPFCDAHALATNTVDPDFDLDGSQEFSDSDGTDDLQGLTVVQHDSVLRTIQWLNGYNI